MAKSSKSRGGAYEVGYGKPPKATQFKKGRSGNPQGRPRKQPTIEDTVLRALNRKVRVRDGERIREITQFEAVVLKTLERSMKGDPKATDQVIRLAHLMPGETDRGIQQDIDGTELTSEMQDQILAEFLAMNGVAVSSDEGDTNDPAD